MLAYDDDPFAATVLSTESECRQGAKQKPVGIYNRSPGALNFYELPAYQIQRKYVKLGSVVIHHAAPDAQDLKSSVWAANHTFS